MFLKNLFLKQYNTGPFIGASRALFSSAQSYMSMINFGMVAALAYEGNVGKTLLAWFPWLNFWVYITVFVVGYLLLMLFEWKIVTPSVMTMGNQQGYKHQNLLRRDIEELKASTTTRLDRIEEQLKELLKK